MPRRHCCNEPGPDTGRSGAARQASARGVTGADLLQLIRRQRQRRERLGDLLAALAVAVAAMLVFVGLPPAIAG